jgi:peptidyl-prolyl cis-trans isomerase SurA
MKIAVFGLVALLASPAGLLAQDPAPPAPAAPHSQIIQRVIVKVNGEIFTQTDLVERQIEVLKDRKLPVTSAEDLQNNERLKATLVEITPDILLSAVDEMLLLQRGKELGYKFNESEFTAQVEKIKKENKLDDASFRKALEAEGLTFDSWRASMERNYIVVQVQRNEIMQRAALTDEEAKQYYQKHPDQFMTPATVTLREITALVPTQTRDNRPTFSVGAEEDAKTKITAIRERVEKGEDFAKVAGEASESGSKANGGLLGSVNLDDLDPILRTTIEKLGVGQVSEPVRTGAGFTIFKMESKSTPTLKLFDTVHDEIAQKIYAERVEAETKKYLVKLRAQALIEWKDDVLKKSYESALGRATGTTGSDLYF